MTNANALFIFEIRNIKNAISWFGRLGFEMAWATGGLTLVFMKLGSGRSTWKKGERITSSDVIRGDGQ